MTINYAPLEEDPVFIVPRKYTEPAAEQKNKQTECMTVLMLFIGGVMLLALSDTVR